MAMDPSRAGPEFAATVNRTWPFPDPPLDVNAIHGTLTLAVHAQTARPLTMAASQNARKNPIPGWTGS